jgi:hypothetical protein
MKRALALAALAAALGCTGHLEAVPSGAPAPAAAALRADPASPPQPVDASRASDSRATTDAIKRSLAALRLAVAADGALVPAPPPAPVRARAGKRTARASAAATQRGAASAPSVSRG